MSYFIASDLSCFSYFKSSAEFLHFDILPCLNISVDFAFSVEWFQFFGRFPTRRCSMSVFDQSLAEHMIYIYISTAEVGVSFSEIQKCRINNMRFLKFCLTSCSPKSHGYVVEIFVCSLRFWFKDSCYEKFVCKPWRNFQSRTQLAQH